MTFLILMIINSQSSAIPNFFFKLQSLPPTGQHVSLIGKFYLGIYSDLILVWCKNIFWILAGDGFQTLQILRDWTLLYP